METKLEKFLVYLRSQGLLKNTAPDNKIILETYLNHAHASNAKKIPEGYIGFTQGKGKEKGTPSR